MKIKLSGAEYDLQKTAKRISVWQYLELEDETGITVDQLEEGELSSSRSLAAYAYLIRRHQGEDVTFRQAAEELIPEDAFVSDDDEPAPAADPSPSAPTDSSRGDDSQSADVDGSE